MTSSIQSVAGQPVASPDSIPAHHGRCTPSEPHLAAMSSVSLSISSQVVGTVQPFSANIDGEYHTKDFTLAPSGGA